MRTRILLLVLLIIPSAISILLFFFFHPTATTEIYTLSLHDALPICARPSCRRNPRDRAQGRSFCRASKATRSEEHTSELQSRFDLVCRLLLEKKKKKTNQSTTLSKHLLPYNSHTNVRNSSHLKSL